MRRFMLIPMLVALLLLAPPASSKTFRLGHWSPGYGNTRNAIYFEFCHGYHYCALGDEAMRVSSCETGGTFSVWAQNGEHLGLFQMGSHERATFGYGIDPWRQAAGARRYYDYEVRRGYNGWDPWVCKP